MMASLDPFMLQQQKRRALRDFDHRMKMLLTDGDREYVYNVLKEFKIIRDVDKLMACMRSVLETPAKLDILKDIRNFVPSAQIDHYDRIAPYHKMATPWPNVHMATPKSSKKHLMLRTPQQTPKSTPKMRPKIQIYDTGSQEYMMDDSIEVIDGMSLRNLTHSITIVKDRQENLGFSIRGGSEHGLGIYVSEIEAGSAADRAGLEIGDHIVEVNTIRFDSIASSSAVKVLTGSNRLKMAIKRVGKIPGFRSAKAKISWYDVTEKKIVDGDTIDHQKVHDNPAGLGYVDGVERRINLAVASKEGQVLGFNIRGGSEFGLGIYVSRVDAGGLAEQQGLKMGDQITHCNGESFEGLSHSDAVGVMKSQRQLVLTARDSGRFPAYKEIYAEYQWINAYLGTITRTRPTGQIDSIPVLPPSSGGPDIKRGMFTEFPTESRVEAFAQTDDEADDSIMIETVGNHNSSFETGVQTQAKSFFESDSETQYLDTELEPSSPRVLVPHVSDIIMSERPQETTPVKERKDRRKDRTPKSTLAVRAMEIETRKKHPELALELERLAQENNSGSSDIGSENGKKKSRSLRGLLFGSKSKGSKDKSASQGASLTRTRMRAPLSNINFESNSLSHDEDESSAFASGIGSQLSLKEAMNSSVHSAVEDKAKRLLSADEAAAVMRHIQRYEKEKKLQNLVAPLVALLDTPQKSELFHDIRSIVQPSDLETYDALTNMQGLEDSIELTSFKTLEGGDQHLYEDVNGRSAEVNGAAIQVLHANGVEPIHVTTDISSKEQAHRVSSHSDNTSAKRHNRESNQRVSRRSDGKTDFTMRRASGQTKVYKAVVDIDFGESHGERASSVSSSRSSNYSNEQVVVAQVEAHPVKSRSYNDNMYASAGSDITRHSQARAVSPASSVLSSVAVPESEAGGSGMAGFIDLANTRPVYAQVEQKVREEDVVSQADSLASATAGFNFLDNLDVSTPTHSARGCPASSQRTSTPSPPATPKSTRSDISDSSGTREGFYTVNSLNTSKESDSSGTREGNYEVNPDPNPTLDSITVSHASQPTSINYDYASDSLRRRALGLPPLFNAPPPPMEPPPSESELEEWGTENGSVYNQNESILSNNGSQNSSSVLSSASVVRYTETSFSRAVRTSVKESGNKSMGATDEVTLTNEVVYDRRSRPSSSSGYQRPTFSSTQEEDLQSHRRILRVILDKSHKSLGISISGGSDSKHQPDIKINGIFPGGAATEEGTLKPGMQLISVDDYDMSNVTHLEAVDIIRKSYADKSNLRMEWVVTPLEESSAF